MNTYISVLRGINVSGHRLIKMDALRTMYEALGFVDVQTYIQSGNVVFRCNKREVEDLQQEISRNIQDTFSFDVLVIVFSIDELKQAIKQNPLAKDKAKDTAFMHITFPPSTPAKKTLRRYNPNNTHLMNSGGKAKQSTSTALRATATPSSPTAFESKLKVTATTRTGRR